MNLVTLLLAPFGLTFKYKTLDQIISGLLLSLFITSWCFMAAILPFSNRSSTILVLKLTSFICFSSMVLAYILLKRRIEKFYGMYDEIVAFNTKRIPIKNYLDTSLVMFIICSVCSFFCIIFNPFFYEKFVMIFHPFLSQQFLSYYFFLAIFYYLTMVFNFQFIIHDLCEQYYDLLEFSNQFIEWYLKYKPNFVIRYQVMEVIEKFKENENDFKLIVYPIRKLTFVFYLSLNIRLFFILSDLYNLYGLYSLYFLLYFLFFIFTNLYYIYTKIVIHFKSKIQNKLLTNIETWIHTSDDQFAGKIITTEFQGNKI